MTHASILTLPSDANPRLIRASDTGVYYAIAAGAAGSAAAIVGGATVPDNATILPAQAFIDNIEAVYYHTPGQGLNLSNKGLTHFASSLLYTSGDLLNGRLVFASLFDDTFTINLSGNALPVADVNAILAACAAGVAEGPVSSTFSVNLTGGTNAAPTGQGIIDKTSLNVDYAWTVTTN